MFCHQTYSVYFFLSSFVFYCTLVCMIFLPMLSLALGQYSKPAVFNQLVCRAWLGVMDSGPTIYEWVQRDKIYFCSVSKRIGLPNNFSVLLHCINHLENIYMVTHNPDKSPI